MIPTDGKMRKVHHAVSMALKLKRTKIKRSDALVQIKNQYMLDNEQTCIVWHAADLAKNDPDSYASYDEAIREARQAGVETEAIYGKHDHLTDPQQVEKQKPATKAAPKKSEQKPKKQAKTKTSPASDTTEHKTEHKESEDDELFIYG